MFDYTWEGTPPKGVPSGPALGVDTITQTLYVSNPQSGTWQQASVSGSSLSGSGNSVALSTAGINLTDSKGNKILLIPNVGVVIGSLASSTAFIELFDLNSNNLQIGGTTNNWVIANGTNGALIQNPVGGNTVQIHGAAITLDGPTTLTSATPTVSSGQLGIGTTTATTATAGAQTLPAQPAGFLVLNLGGTAIKVPYYNA
jgi:hypothetical protein